MNARTLLLTLFALVAFAANSLLCRAALAHGDTAPMPFTAARLLSGALVLIVVARATRGRLERPDAWGALALFLYAAPFALAYVRIPAGTGALLLFGAVQLTILGAALARGERVRAVEWVGLALAIVGLVVLVLPGLAAPPLASAALMVGAGVAWGVYTLRGRTAPDALARTAANFTLAAPLAIGAALVSEGLAMRMSSHGLAMAAVSGAVTSGLGYAGWYAALPGLTRARAGIVQLAVPALAALGGVAFLGEHPTLRLVASAALILGGVGLALVAHAAPSRSLGPEAVRRNAT